MFCFDSITVMNLRAGLFGLTLELCEWHTCGENECETNTIWKG